MHKVIFVLLCAVSLTGCFQQVSKPSEITLVDAMTQVGKGLAAMRAEQGDAKTGLIAETATVTFNIAASSNVDTGLKVDLAPPAVSEGVEAGGTLDSKRASSRSNAVTVTFKNILVLPKETVGYVLAGTEDNGKGTKLERVVDGFDIQLFMHPVTPAAPRE